MTSRTTPRRTRRPTARPAARQTTSLDAMLDAAEEVVLKDGIGHLTLDAVARRVKLSKSGLLHHFPTKDALIDALVARVVDGWRTGCEAALAATPPGAGRFPRAIMGHCLGSTDKLTDQLRRRSKVLVAAMVHDPSRVEPLRKVQREHIARAAVDGLPPGVGEAILLVSDGLWFDWIFGISEPTEQRLREIREALGRWVESFTKDPRTPARRRGRATRGKD
jgi:AcrR family transcriptional regulator